MDGPPNPVDEYPFRVVVLKTLRMQLPRRVGWLHYTCHEISREINGPIYHGFFVLE